MMVIHRPKEKLAIIVAFLLPLVLVKGGAIVTGSGPEQAQATPGGHVKPPPLPVVPELPGYTAEQRLASEHIEFLRSQPFGASPLFHMAAPVTPDRPENPTHPTRPEAPPPNVVVKAILIRSDGNHVALIDRKRYQVGNPLGDHSWFIVEIDGRSRSVIIEHRPSKRTATLTVPLPR